MWGRPLMWGGLQTIDTGGLTIDVGGQTIDVGGMTINWGDQPLLWGGGMWGTNGRSGGADCSCGVTDSCFWGTD